MVDIVIKSFNRPYYLDRCLQSISEHVSGEFKIIILDDGTPEKYLNKIRNKHQKVEIRLSKQYNLKVSSITENLETGKEINGLWIPTDLWIETIKNASQFVMVIEDDVWFTESIDLDNFTNQMQMDKIDLLKLGWLGTGKTKSEIARELSDKINAENLQGIFTSNEFLMDCLIYNKFKLFSILYRLGFVDNETKKKYWKLNSILMGLWRKEYWLHIWKDANNGVDEKQQLRNAATWLHKNKSNPNMVGEVKKNSVKTTFQSSATNSYHKYGYDFDVNYFNHLMNEAWLRGDFDAMENFPDDFSLGYFDSFLDERIDQLSFHKWVEKFKDQYRNLGYEID